MQFEQYIQNAFFPSPPKNWSQSLVSLSPSFLLTPKVIEEIANFFKTKKTIIAINKFLNTSKDKTRRVVYNLLKSYTYQELVNDIFLDLSEYEKDAFKLLSNFIKPDKAISFKPFPSSSTQQEIFFTKGFHGLIQNGYDIKQFVPNESYQGPRADQ
jgi:hypothetical protein